MLSRNQIQPNQFWKHVHNKRNIPVRTVVGPGRFAVFVIRRHLIHQQLQLLEHVRVYLLSQITAREFERFLEHARVGHLETMDFTHVAHVLQRVNGGDLSLLCCSQRRVISQRSGGSWGSGRGSG